MGKRGPSIVEWRDYETIFNHEGASSFYETL